MYQFKSESVVNRPIAEVFDFFSQAANLARLSPPSIHFQIVTPQPITMKVGTLIEYRLRLFGVPFRWASKISVWEPGHRFSDIQLRGPYKSWDHEHRFETSGENATTIYDTVNYEAPGGILAPLINTLFIRPQIKQIFAYRAKAIREIFGD